MRSTLTRFCGVYEAIQLTGLSGTTLRGYADRGTVRSIKDPVGRRLLLREDVEKLIVERERRRAERAKNVTTERG